MQPYEERLIHQEARADAVEEDDRIFFILSIECFVAVGPELQVTESNESIATPVEDARSENSIQ